MLFDTLVRYSSITILMVLVLLLVRDARQHQAARFAALVALSVAALLLTTPYPQLELPPIPHTILRFVDAPSIAFIWWFGRSLFEDDFKLGWREWAGWLLVFLPTVVYRLNELGYLQMNLDLCLYFSAAVSTALMLHLIWLVTHGRKDDVIEARRKFRFAFVLGLVAATLSIVLSERLFSPRYDIELSTFRSLVTLPLAIWALLSLVRVTPEKLAFAETLPSRALQPKVDENDSALHASLRRLMEEDKFYQQAGLTIRQLAERLKCPEHRLRALINKGLGYRNFSRFINEYRVQAVQQAMQADVHRKTPILTMALNVGFNSLAPFNRAFRDIVGITPTAYRETLASQAQNED